MMCSLESPVSSLWAASSMCLMSTSKRSVAFMRRSIFANVSPVRLNVTPLVSRHVWTSAAFAASKNSIIKSICAKGSPPLTVMPPSVPQ